MIPLILHIFIFTICLIAIPFLGNFLLDAIRYVARFLGWKEFVVGFFFLAFSVSLPNLIFGVISAIRNVPELSLGDVIGGNIFDLTVVVGLGALISKEGLSALSRTVQQSVLFLFFTNFLFFVLVSDAILSRLDGVLLITLFFIYLFWIFQREDRFKKVYEEGDGVKITIKGFVKNLFAVLFSTALILFFAIQLVNSSMYLLKMFHFPILIFGALLVGLGNSIPETNLTLQSARRGEDWLILGDLIGGVMITMTLVLGVVSLISPILISDLNLLLIARIFLLFVTVFFIFFLRTGKKITKKEGICLIVVYVVFVLIAIYP